MDCLEHPDYVEKWLWEIEVIKRMAKLQSGYPSKCSVAQKTFDPNRYYLVKPKSIPQSFSPKKEVCRAGIPSRPKQPNPKTMTMAWAKQNWGVRGAETHNHHDRSWKPSLLLWPLSCTRNPPPKPERSSSQRTKEQDYCLLFISNPSKIYKQFTWRTSTFVNFVQAVDPQNGCHLVSVNALVTATAPDKTLSRQNLTPNQEHQRRAARDSDNASVIASEGLSGLMRFFALRVPYRRCHCSQQCARQAAFSTLRLQSQTQLWDLADVTADGARQPQGQRLKYWKHGVRADVSSSVKITEPGKIHEGPCSSDCKWANKQTWRMVALSGCHQTSPASSKLLVRFPSAEYVLICSSSNMDSQVCSHVPMQTWFQYVCLCLSLSVHPSLSVCVAVCLDASDSECLCSIFLRASQSVLLCLCLPVRLNG